MHDLFISYAREDRSRVQALAAALESMRGWSVWWDSEVRTGDRFPRQIQTVLAESRCVLVVWSRHSVQSDWVCAEAAEGWRRGVLVPVSFDASEPPMPFRQTQTADLSAWRGSQRAPALLTLVEDIERMLASGVAAGAEELVAREARRRAARRRRVLRWTVTAVALAALLAGAGLGWQGLTQHRARAATAEALADRADALRATVVARSPEQENTIWWALLLHDPERIDRLEQSLLLAIEAMRVQPGDRAEQSLRAGLALLPWSDWQLETDFDNHIGTLEFSHDGRLLAAGGGAGDTLVWDFRAADVRARIPHGGTGGAERWREGGANQLFRSHGTLAFSPVAELLATAGPDATARLWTPSDGAERARLAHDDIVLVVTFSPDGELLASASHDGTARLWDVATARELARLQHAGPVRAVEFSASGALLATASDDRSVAVWTRAGEPVVRIAHERPPAGMRFAPDESLLVTFGEDLETTLWTLPAGRAAWTVPEATQAGVAFDEPGRIMVVAGADGELGWWDLARREALFSIAEVGFVRQMASRRGRLVTVGADEIAHAWALATGQAMKQMPHSGWLTAGAISPDGELMASAGEDMPRSGIEVTRIWPADPVAAACAKLSRNLTRNEWRDYLGELPYRPTCPAIDAGAH